MSLYTMRVVYGLLDTEINNWYQKRIDGKYPDNYNFDQIRELEYNLESLDRLIKEQE